MSSLLPAVKLWIWLSALASAAGWGLSAFGWLNQTGYLVSFGVGALLLWLARQPLDFGQIASGRGWKKIRRRFRRPLPAAFAALAFLTLLGSAIHPPTTHTAYTYHIPRILHWLAEGQWIWIHAPDCRMNSHACGMEWMMCPILLFTKSDRALFVLNLIVFLLLPGLIFSLWTRLGVRPRVAWRWMWLLPTGYTFLIQAGSVKNDVFPAVYALAAFDFAWRAWASRRLSDLWYSLLAVSLLTGAKASNVPLLLPWVILSFKLLPLARRRPVVTACICLLAVLISFFPNAVLNKAHAGEWLGLNQQTARVEMKNPVAGIVGNGVQILLANFAPTVFPMAKWWNRHAPEFMPQSIVKLADDYFDTGFFQLGEVPTEDWAGLGFGVSVLLVVSLVAAFRVRNGKRRPPAAALAVPTPLRRLVLAGFWLALGGYCVKSGMVTAARLISPYYALIIPTLLLGQGQAVIVRKRWWSVCSWGVVALAFVALVIQPGRQLWPQQAVLSKLLARYPESASLARAQKVYSVYTRRSDPLPQVRSLLPPDIRVVGFMGTADDISISMWRPFGTRRVALVLLDDTAVQIRQAGAQYVVVSGLLLKERNRPLSAWLEQVQAEWVATTTATVTLTHGPQEWHIVRLKD